MKVSTQIRAYPLRRHFFSASNEICFKLQFFYSVASTAKRMERLLCYEALLGGFAVKVREGLM